MTEKVEIVYTDTFYQLLDSLITYQSDYSDEVAVIERIEEVIDRFEQQIGSHPKSANIAPYLLDLGVKEFREFHANDLLIIFRVKERQTETKVVVDAIAKQNQDLEHLLVRHCMLYR